VHALVDGCTGFEYGVTDWDLVVMTYVTFEVASPPSRREDRAPLRPGGLVVVLESAVAGPTASRRNRVEIDPDEVRTAYGALTEIAFEHSTSTSDRGLRPRPLVRFAARRDCGPTPAAPPP
jgi:hypothetical protein